MMKKLFLALAIMITGPAIADEYDVYDGYDLPSFNNSDNRQNYAGFRIHKNENIAFRFDIQDGGHATVRTDNWGFGAVVGNKLSSFAKIEFETMYTGAKQSRKNTDYDFDVWANMLNFYLFQEYAGAIAPYVGVGIGFSTIWGDVDAPYGHMSDTVFDLSYSAMIGVNFALNDRVDLNLGVKYQFYGELEHELGDETYAITDVDATEFYFGAVYKFGI